MRIAICVSGQPRAIPVCVESLQTNLLAGREADFFVHLWSRSTLDRIQDYAEFTRGESLRKRVFRRARLRKKYAEYVASKERILATYSTDHDAIEAEASQAYDPTTLVVEAQRVFDTSAFGRAEQNQTLRRGETRIANTLSMFFSIWRASELKRAHEAAHGFVYDLVIRCRSDLFFFEPVALAAVEEGLGKRIFAPGRGWRYHGINDQLALGSSAHIDAYSDTYHRIRDYYAAGGSFHPETILRSCLREQGVEVAPLELAYEIVRGDWSGPEAYLDGLRRGIAEGSLPKGSRER